MQQIAMTLTALLLVVTMLVHSILGQKRLIRLLLNEKIGVMQRPLARFLVPFAWHLTSALGLIIAAILLGWAWQPGNARTIGLSATATVFIVGGIGDAIGSTGRHVGWPILTAIGLCALVALLTH